MSCHISTYELLVDKFGEATAYRICEELGGVKLEIPNKAHKTFRIRRIIEKALPLIQEDASVKRRIVKKLTKFQEVNESHIYKIIREVEYGK